jgi:hypothetical protein
MNLEKVGSLVAARSAESSPHNESKLGKAEAEKAIVRAMFTWMSWGLLVLGIGGFDTCS